MFPQQRFLFLLPSKDFFYLSMLRNTARTLTTVQSSHLNFTPLICLFFHLVFFFLSIFLEIKDILCNQENEDLLIHVTGGVSLLTHFSQVLSVSAYLFLICSSNQRYEMNLQCRHYKQVSRHGIIQKNRKQCKTPMATAQGKTSMAAARVECGPDTSQATSTRIKKQQFVQLQL